MEESTFENISCEEGQGFITYDRLNPAFAGLRDAINELRDTTRLQSEENKSLQTAIKIQMEDNQSLQAKISSQNREIERLEEKFQDEIKIRDAKLHDEIKRLDDKFQNSDVGSLLSLISHCNFDVPKNAELASHLLETALKLKMAPLIAKCEEVLRDLLTVDNCVRTLKMASADGLNNLKEKAHQYIVEHIRSILKDEDKYCSLTFDEVYQVLSSNDLKINEFEVFDALVLWVRYDVSERRPRISELTKAVRLSLCDMRFLRSIREHYLLHDCKVLQDDVAKIIKLVETESPKLAALQEKFKRNR